MRGYKRKIDYCNKIYQNPYFRKKYVLLSLRIKLLLTGTIIFIIIAVWFFCFNNFFNIKKIDIHGLSRISNQEIQDFIWYKTKNKRFIFFQQKNLIIFNKNQTIKDLNQKYFFEKLDINKKLPNTLIVNIKERSYAYIWHEEDKYYYADINGYIISETNPLEIKNTQFPFIENKNNTRITQNQININKDYTNFIIELFKKFQSWNDGNGVEIDRFFTDQDINTVNAIILNGPVVKFTIKSDLKKQLDKLFILKTQKLKDNFQNQEYIDLRYGDRVYYK